MNTITQTSPQINLSDLPARFRIERFGNKYTVIQSKNRTSISRQSVQFLMREATKLGGSTSIEIGSERSYGKKYVLLAVTNPTPAQINHAFEDTRLADQTETAVYPAWSIGDTVFADNEAHHDLLATQYDMVYPY